MLSNARCMERAIAQTFAIAHYYMDALPFYISKTVTVKEII